MAPKIFAEQPQHFYLTKERASAQGFIDLICLGLSTAIFRDFPETQSAFVASERLQTTCPQTIRVRDDLACVHSERKQDR
jgi:hypothetical protein